MSPPQKTTRDCCLNGKFRGANPHDPLAQSIAFDRWECGWLDAKDIHEEHLAQCAIPPQVDD